MCLGCLGPAPIPATEKAGHYQKAIYFFMAMLLVVAILDIVAKAILPGIFGIMLLLILFLASRQMSHQMVMIFIFFSLYFAVVFLVQFLTPIQNEDDLNKYSDIEMFRFIIYIISFVFYITCAIFFFFPYKEFKAISFSQNPALQAYFNNPGSGEQYDHDDKKKPNNQEIGTYNVDYGDFQSQQPQQQTQQRPQPPQFHQQQIKLKTGKNNGKTGKNEKFTQFKGQGVRIG